MMSSHNNCFWRVSWIFSWIFCRDCSSERAVVLRSLSSLVQSVDNIFPRLCTVLASFRRFVLNSLDEMMMTRSYWLNFIYPR